jgi:hypothetical protein
MQVGVEEILWVIPSDRWTILEKIPNTLIYSTNTCISQVGVRINGNKFQVYVYKYIFIFMWVYIQDV